MSENQLKELSGIERELVLQYLRDDNVPLTVTLEDKPDQVEADLSQEMTLNIRTEQKIPASAIFPVAIKSQQIEVLNQGIILLKNSVRSVQAFLGKQVRVQFYFNHVGLYFITTMKEYSQGLAIVVPSKIYRIPDVSQKADYEFKAVISYNDQNGDSVDIECVPSADYRLFQIPRWDEIPVEHQKNAKVLLEKFVSQVKSGEISSVGNGTHLLSVVKKLTVPAPIQFKSNDATIESPEVIFASQNLLIISGRTEHFNFVQNNVYNLSLIFTVPDHKHFKRVINLNCKIENIYRNEDSSDLSCWACSFLTLQPEDERYLYERITGKKSA